MYDTSKTNGEKQSNCWKRNRIFRCNHSHCHQKHRNGTPTPNLRTSDGIFLIYIRYRIDWCIKQAKQLVRRHRIVKKGAHMTSNIDLPIHQKNQNGTPTPNLLQSDSIFLIYDRFRVDWCIKQAKKTVRRHRIVKKGRQVTRNIDIPMHQKRQNETPTPYPRPSDSISLIYIRFRLEWCMIQVKKMVRRRRKKKKWKHNHPCGHLPFREENSSLSTSVEDIRFLGAPLSSLINSWQDDIKFMDICGICMGKNGIGRVCLASWRCTHDRWLVWSARWSRQIFQQRILHLSITNAPNRLRTTLWVFHCPYQSKPQHLQLKMHYYNPSIEENCRK